MPFRRINPIQFNLHDVSPLDELADHCETVAPRLSVTPWLICTADDGVLSASYTRSSNCRTSGKSIVPPAQEPGFDAKAYCTVVEVELVIITSAPVDVPAPLVAHAPPLT